MKPGKFTCKGNPVDPNEIGQLSVEACKKRLAELSKGLAHPARVEIVRMLENKPLDERCVCGDIVNALPLAQSSVSQHLKVLKETGTGYRERLMGHAFVTARSRASWNIILPS